MEEEDQAHSRCAHQLLRRGGEEVYYDGLREIKNGEVECDVLFLELQEIQMACLLRRKSSMETSIKTHQHAVDGITNEDADALLKRLAHTPLGTGVPSPSTSVTDTELVAALDLITKASPRVFKPVLFSSFPTGEEAQTIFTSRILLPRPPSFPA